MNKASVFHKKVTFHLLTKKANTFWPAQDTNILRELNEVIYCKDSAMLVEVTIVMLGRVAYGSWRKVSRERGRGMRKVGNDVGVRTLLASCL